MTAELSKKLNVALKDFLTYLDVSKATQKLYAYNVGYFLKYLMDHKVDRPDKKTFIAYKNYLVSAGKKSNTINNYIVPVRRFFQWLNSNCLYINITDGVKGARVDHEFKKDCLTGAQAGRVINQTNLSPRDRAIVALMAVDGLRCIEVSRANVEDLRTTNGLILLAVQGKGRTSKSERVKLSPEVEALIRSYLLTRKNLKEGAPLFVSFSHRNAGSRLTTRSISRIVKEALISAGMNSPRLTAHSLRHTAVTLALKSGHSIQEVARFARHSDLSTTLIYAHNLDDESSLCSIDVSRAIFGRVAGCAQCAPVRQNF